jgi:signal transduction histidine kinase
MRLESLANLAHELRTPVQVLTGYLEILRENLSPGADSEAREIVERMNSNTHELAQTIENLMEHVLAEAGATGPWTAEEVPLRSLVAEVAPVLEAANASKHLKVSFDLAHAAETIRAPRQALRSILLNLALNAIKFTDSGSVTIAVRRLGDTIGEENVIEISDTGPGMSRWMLAQALTPFAQLSRGSDRRHRGLGLGLTVTQRNVAALGGRLELSSIAGQGSRFTVRIPQPRSVPRQLRAAAQPDHRPSAHG